MATRSAGVGLRAGRRGGCDTDRGLVGAGAGGGSQGKSRRPEGARLALGAGGRHVFDRRALQPEAALT